MKKPPNLQIAVGVIFSEDKSQVLIANRPIDKPHGGKWEFPGGKIALGETAFDGLKRELFEELGIIVELADKLTVINHDYPDFPSVSLQVYQVIKYSGKPYSKEGQLIKWESVNSLADYSFPSANNSIINLILNLTSDSNLDCATS